MLGILEHDYHENVNTSSGVGVKCRFESQAVIVIVVPAERVERNVLSAKAHDDHALYGAVGAYDLRCVVSEGYSFYLTIKVIFERQPVPQSSHNLVDELGHIFEKLGDRLAHVAREYL